MSTTSQRATAQHARQRANELTHETAAAELWRHVGSAGVLEYLTPADVRDLADVRDHIRGGRLAVALEYASTLDTAVREEIPLAVWAFIGGGLLHE